MTRIVEILLTSHEKIKDELVRLVLEQLNRQIDLLKKGCRPINQGGKGPENETLKTCDFCLRSETEISPIRLTADDEGLMVCVECEPKYNSFLP